MRENLPYQGDKQINHSDREIFLKVKKQQISENE